MHLKRFLDWISLKERLHSKFSKAPNVCEGELWWASIGENVGFEIDGKSDLFSRPVIIFRKLSHCFYFVIPISTQLKNGSWYVQFDLKDVVNTACLHQARSIDYRRLSSKLGELEPGDLERVFDGFCELYIGKFPAG
jgi:mRNA interferase MazF